MKRILLLVLTNVLIVVVLGIASSLLGVNRFLTSNGLDLGLLLAPLFRCSSANPWPSGARACR